MEIKSHINAVSFISPIQDRGKCIPVILVCDGWNIPETMVTILSISELQDDFYYDVVIMHYMLDEYDISAFEHMVSNFNVSKVKLRFQKVELKFTRGYIYLDSNYKEEYVLKCFLPIILKRYTKFLFVRSGNVLKTGISRFYESFTGEHKFEVISVGRLAEIVVYNSVEFKMKYSVVDIKNSMTKGIAELDIDFFRSLSGLTSTESPNGIVEIYNVEQPPILFKKLISRVPYFEKWIYEWNMRNQVSVVTENYSKPVYSDFFLFPFELVPQNAKIVLYGNGKVGQQYRQQIEITCFCKLIAVVDKNVKEGILALQELNDLEFDYVIIAVANDGVADEISNNLKMNGVKADKIIYATQRKLLI